MKLSLLLFFPILAIGQVWEKQHAKQLVKVPTAYASDFQDNFYLGFADGGLTKYDKNGEILENFSLSNSSTISLIDVQNNLKPFIFYFDNQQITVLDRFSSIPKHYFLQDFGIELGLMACPSPDGDLWVIENNPQRLKKINPLRKTTLLETQMILGDTIRKMQAYQNLLLIAHNEGLHVLDQFGGKVYSMSQSEILGFQRMDTRLILYTPSQMWLVDLFGGEILAKYDLPMAITGLVASKSNFILIQESKLYFYSF